MLFILVTDTLNRFLGRTEQSMPPNAYLTPKTIQFADDTVIVTEAHPTSLRIISRVLKVYEELTWLKIKRAKSTFIAIVLCRALRVELRKRNENILC